MTTKNSGHIEDLPDDACRAVIDDVKRKASAIQECAKVTAAVEHKEVEKQQGAATDAKFKEAGAEEEAKLAEGNPEGKIVEETVLSSPAANIAVNLGEQLLAGKSNPSKSSNPSVKEAVGRGAQSMEDLTAKMKHAPIQTPLGRGLFEKSGTLKESMKSLSSGDTTGVKSSTVDAASSITSVAEVKHSLDFGQSLANEAKLQRAMQLERQHQGPSGPGGMGGGSAPRMASRGMTLENNSMKNGPSGPNFNEEEAVS